ncbi:hypothetical protein BVZ75_01528B, partial [Haemophilus influenzae]
DSVKRSVCRNQNLPAFFQRIFARQKCG